MKWCEALFSEICQWWPFGRFRQFSTNLGKPCFALVCSREIYHEIRQSPFTAKVKNRPSISYVRLPWTFYGSVLRRIRKSRTRAAKMQKYENLGGICNSFPNVPLWTNGQKYDENDRISSRMFEKRIVSKFCENLVLHKSGRMKK